MACILKKPNKSSKGVITFTNIEYFSQIKQNKKIIQLIRKMKKDWIVCYHPNWQDLSFYNDGLFDAVISNKESFNFSDNSVKKILIDTASNRMAPAHFKLSQDKKWDFCHVSRYQKSKNISGFFRVIKSSFKIKNDLTGILIISVKNKKEVQKIRKEYNKLFSKEEKQNFELITLTYNFPFPLSKKVLAHLYTHSKVTLNTHLNEPHGRVVGYALACGLPVVGYNDLSFMVEEKYRVKPFFYLSKVEMELSELLIEAVNYVNSSYNTKKHKEIGNMYSEVEQSLFLKQKLQDKFKLDNLNWNLYQLDERLSTHYYCSNTTNTFNVSILQLAEYIIENGENILHDESSISVKINKTININCILWRFMNNIKVFVKNKLYLLVRIIKE